MAISTGSKVNFIYISTGSDLPSTIDDSTIYYMAETKQMYIGSQLIADATDYEKIESDMLQFDTSAGWTSKPTLVSNLGCVYVYTDYETYNNHNVPGFKFGDGSSYVVDLPFSDILSANHRADTSIHVTTADKTSWNNKVTCYLDPVDNNVLVFSKS